MWRLNHWLFGWHYVHVESMCSEGIRKVYVNAAGERYVHRYSDHLIFIDRPDCGWKVTPLTWVEDTSNERSLRAV